MSTVRRDFKASPQRTGTETWEAVARLLAPEDGAARRELQSAAGTAGQLIATESVKEFPIIAVGSGPRVHIYCLYDDDALEEDNANEATLAFDATSKDWKVSIPVLKEDIAWSQTELSKVSSRISVREKSQSFGSEDEKKSASSSLQLDTTAFLKQ
jgi:hypothetical protein